ncbi:MAG: beta strand repeat-containing protein [Chitinophagaceae bacterium]
MRKQLRFTLLLFAMCYFSSQAQVSIGTSTYTTLKAAFDAINAGTHTGSINVNITGSTTETATAELVASGVGAASYTSILIKPTVAGVTISGNISGGALVNLNGADNVTIDGRVGTNDTRQLTFINTTTTTLSAVIRLSSVSAPGLGATNNVVQYCNISGGISSTTAIIYGIYAGGTTITATGGGADNDTLNFSNNAIQRVHTAIYARGTTTANPNDSLVIADNQLGADIATDFIAVNGIQVTNSTRINISRNRIFNIKSDGSNACVAVNLSGGGNSNIFISRNVIRDIVNTTTINFRGGQGIYVTGTGNVNAIIANNLIYGLQGHGSGTNTNNAWGIIVGAGNNFNIYYNTIISSGTGPTSTSTDRSGCILLNNTSSNGINLLNNNLVNSRVPSNTTSGGTYCIYSSTPVANLGNFNNNNYFSTGTRARVGYITGVDRNTLGDWITATLKDSSSLSVNPKFSSSTQFSVSTASSLLNAGTPVANVTTDILGVTRSLTTPTIGAYETPVDVTDASVLATYTLGSLALNYSANHVVSARVLNSGSSSLTNLAVTLSITGANTFNNVQTISSLAPGDSATVSFNGFTPTADGINTVTVSVGNDDDTSNNSKSVTQLVTGNSLTYAVGTNAVGGVGFNSATGDFVAKFNTAIAAQLNQCVVNFFVGGQQFQLGVWDATGAGGTPGALLYSSPTYTSTAGAYTVLIDPTVSIPAGDFYIGVRQINTSNVSFAYQTETPIRAGSFYFASPSGSTTWIDFAPANSFRFMINPRFALNNDVAVSAIGVSGSNYLAAGTTSINMVGSVLNAGTQTAGTITVTRTIVNATTSAQVYTNTQVINSLAANASSQVTFAPFNNFISGTGYRIKDSVALAGDQNRANDTTSVFYQPILAKQNLILTSDLGSRDSIINHFGIIGQSNNYDVLPLTFTGSLRPWRTVFYLPASAANWTAALRDSMRAFVDAGAPTAKKSLAVFGNDIGYQNDPTRNTSAPPADTVFYRQYLRGSYIADSWLTTMPASDRKFKSIVTEFGLNATDSTNDAYPDLVRPTNNGIPAFTPISESGNGDSANAIMFTATGGRIFYFTSTYGNILPLAYPNVPFINIYNYLNETTITLPNDVKDIHASLNRDGVLIDWRNTNETNVALYEVERSADGYKYVNIGNTLPKGNGMNGYQFLDRNPFAGGNYYRIKTIGKDRSAKYSAVVFIKTNTNTSDIAIYPNVIKDVTFTLQMNNSPKGKYSVRIFTQNGLLADATDFEHAGGSATRTINAYGMMLSGTYIVEVIGVNGYKQSFKLIKL